MTSFNITSEINLFSSYRNVDIRNLTQMELMTYFMCRDIKSWEEWNISQRKRKRDQIVWIFKRLELPFPVVLLDQFISQLSEHPKNQKKPITGHLRVAYKKGKVN